MQTQIDPAFMTDGDAPAGDPGQDIITFDAGFEKVGDFLDCHWLDCHCFVL